MRQENLPTNYVLEIYEPEDDRTVAGVFDSNTPFMAISKGDYINTSIFPESSFPGLLQVTSVEHILFEIENSHQTHKVCLCTKKAKIK